MKQIRLFALLLALLLALTSFGAAEEMLETEFTFEPEGEIASETAPEILEEADPMPRSIESDFEFSDNEDGTRTLAKYLGKDVNIVIPKEWNVAIIGKNAFNSSAIRSITLPSTVTTIADYAFFHCYSLKTIKLSEGLTTIGAMAFEACTSLKSIKLPKSLKTLGADVFYEAGLTSVTIPEGITEIPDNAFTRCYDLKTINLPKSLKCIGLYSIYECYALKSIKLPDGLTTIRDGAFSWCRNLTSIKIPDTVKTIEMHAFYNCNALRSVTLPKNLERIESYTFMYCSKLKSIVIPDSVKYIDNDAFDTCCQLANITLHGDEITINDAFDNAPSDIRWNVFYGSPAEQYAVSHGYPVTYRKDYTFAPLEKNIHRIIGETVGMDAFVSTPSNPAGAVFTLKSSSAKVLAVDAEALTAEAKAEGSATLTATMTVADPNNAKKPLAKKTASVKVKVVDPNKLASVTIEGEATQPLPVGEVLPLHAAPYPTDEGVTCTWKSSKAAVAAVNAEGEVTAVKKGSATVTVTATQGKIKKTASVRINVVEGN